MLGQPPLVVVLSHEVPTVQLSTRPYEQITVHVDTVTDLATALTLGVGEATASVVSTRAGHPA